MLAIKTEIFNRTTPAARLREIALQLCDRLEAAEGGRVIQATYNERCESCGRASWGASRCGQCTAKD
jgi:hypothetical protein